MHSSLDSINIELTNICNLNCKMCYRKDMHYPIGVMEHAMFSNIVIQLAQLDFIKRVYLHWRGEPMCCSYFIDAINGLASVGKDVILFTNGTLLNSEIINKLVESKLHTIYFSLEANSKEAYLNIRGENQFEKLKSNILQFCEARQEKKSEIRVNISSVVLEDNLLDIVGIKKMWEPYVDHIFFKTDMNAKTELSKVRKCLWPFSSLFVSWDGLVSGCCMDINIEHLLGDIRCNSILEIINSGARSELMEAINNKKAIGYCRKCNIFNNGI